MALTDNLSAYYKFDSNANDSSGTNNGTVSGATSVSGKINNAYSFDGNDYISVNDNDSLDINGNGTSISISAWLFVPSSINTGANMMISKGQEGANARNYTFFVTATTTKFVMEFRAVASNGRSHKTTTEFDRNAWYHVVVTCSHGDSVPIIYVNNVSQSLTATDTASSTYQFVSNSSPLYFGRDANGSNPFIGTIDEVGLWKNKILTSDDVSTLYNSGNGLTYPFSTTSIKSYNSLAKASIKSINGLAIGSIKSINGLT